ncbi:MAG: ABC transporter ATP-binding protein [Nitrospinota bacterium]|nr:MAG: ABC transporter ATP-binding protein [Nitrospinota bacterium]
MTQEVLRLEGVSKVYEQGERRIVALDEITFSVGQGEFVAIIGSSGSGKSTLLHLIGGLDTPTQGDIFLEGRSYAGLSDDELTLLRREKIGIVFQFFNLLPTLTVWENIALPALLLRKPMPEVALRVESLLEMVGLKSRQEHRPHQLSGGEMQRVAIARALINRPSLLLADEPTGNLDSQTGLEILHLLQKVTVQYQTTLLMVTHDREISRFAHRMIQIRDGRIVREDR